MVWPTSPGAMACSRRVLWFLDAPAGLEASSIRAAVSWIGTTEGLTTVELWLQPGEVDPGRARPWTLEPPRD
jgi:hypothetical protein